MMLARVGKAIRTPAGDVMLSYATRTMGRGWGYGLHEAMDQTGATVGPLIIAAVLAWRGDYRFAFAVLLIPALAAAVLWGIGMGAQESIMRAAVAEMTPAARRDRGQDVHEASLPTAAPPIP